MRTWLVLAMALMSFPLMAEDTTTSPVPGKTVKLLTIGNSFARDATTYLPSMAKAGGHELLLFQANPGGCTLERHANWITAHDLDPESRDGKPYPANFTPKREDIPRGKMYSLAEILAAEEWDFVTIQQVSMLSFRPETFEPYAKTIIDCIHENAPGAEILVHQTWAYREDYPGFADGTFTQEMMFEQLQAAYQELAERYDLRVIPVGKAFQQARSTPRWTFQFPDPNFDYKNPLNGTPPDQTGSLNVGWTVRKYKKKVPVESVLGLEEEESEIERPKGESERPLAPSKTEKDREAEPVEMKEVTAYRANLDFKHCLPEGRFIGSTVFYGVLFGEKASENPFVPKGMALEDVVAIKSIADGVLKE